MVSFSRARFRPKQHTLTQRPQSESRTALHSQSSQPTLHLSLVSTNHAPCTRPPFSLSKNVDACTHLLQSRTVGSTRRLCRHTSLLLSSHLSFVFFLRSLSTSAYILVPLLLLVPSYGIHELYHLPRRSSAWKHSGSGTAGERAPVCQAQARRTPKGKRVALRCLRPCSRPCARRVG